MGELAPYKVRFIKEYEELDERVKKLDAMLKKYDEGTLDFTPTCPIELLQEQSRTMKVYRAILEKRAAIEDVPLPIAE